MNVSTLTRKNIIYFIHLSNKFRKEEGNVGLCLKSQDTYIKISYLLLQSIIYVFFLRYYVYIRLIHTDKKNWNRERKEKVLERKKGAFRLPAGRIASVHQTWMQPHQSPSLHPSSVPSLSSLSVVAFSFVRSHGGDSRRHSRKTGLSRYTRTWTGAIRTEKKKKRRQCNNILSMYVYNTRIPYSM